MVRRGHLDVPVVGVAQGGLDARAAPGARPRQPRAATAAASTRRTFAKLLRAPALRGRRLQRPATFAALRKALGDADASRALPRDSAEPVRDRRRRRSARRAARKDARVIVEKPFGRDLASARALNADTAQRVRRVVDLPHRPLPRQGARCRTCSSSASPTRSSSRSGTATTSRACRSRWRRASASRAAARFYEEAGAIRDVIQNHMLQVVGFLAMEPPTSTVPRGDPRRAGEGLPHDPAARARPTWCAASSAATATGAGRRAGLARSRRSPRCGCTSTPGAGTACRS